MSAIFIADPAFQSSIEILAISELADRRRPAIRREHSIERQSRCSMLRQYGMMIAQKVNLANTTNKPSCVCGRLLTFFARERVRTALGRRTSRKLEASVTIRGASK